jgi:hypothetical protein
MAVRKAPTRQLSLLLLPVREALTFLLVGTISRKTSDSTGKCNGQNLLDIAVTNALELLRGQNFEN